jgi:putative thiamine transport system ATP-binding protein
MLRLSQISVLLNTRPLISAFSIDVAAGEVITLMGPSGCGKSSLLSGIAGTLEKPLSLSGEIWLNAKNLNSLRPEQRRVGRLFQDDILFPHLTIGENLLFGIVKGLREDRLGVMRQGLREIELEGFEQRAPHTLSGGQRQRVSLMRSLLAKPDCMLLDEPFSKLDQDLRNIIRATTFNLLKRQNIPTLLVTHDLADAPCNSRVLKITSEGQVVDV